MICVSSDCILPEYNGSACAEIACVHRSCPQLLQNLFLHLPCAFDPALAGAMYGFTGFIEGARIGSNTANTGLNYELDAIAACVIGGVSFVGGIGKIRGIVIGVVMLRLIFVGLTMVGVPQDLQYLIKGAIILFACALDMRKYLVKK